MIKGSASIRDVVQINPESQLAPNDGFFAACFMIVEEIKEWGVQGYIFAPNGPRGKDPGRAYYRAKWDDIEHVGRAVWTVGSEEDDKSSVEIRSPQRSQFNKPS